MTIGPLQNAFDHLWVRWNTWWRECFPSAAPLAEVREIPERHVLFAQLEEVRAGHARALALRQAAITTLSKELAEAETRVETIRQEITAQYRADFLANLQADTDTERLQAMVIEKAPLSLCMFIEEIDSELWRLRRMEPTIVPNGRDRDYVRMKKTVRFQTNAGSIKRRVVALLTARERAIGMLTENMTVQDIIGEVYRLRQAFPEIIDEDTRGSHAAMVLG